MRLVFLVMLLAVASPAASISKSFRFDQVVFGDMPYPGMICTGGVCPGEEIPPGKVFYAKYQFPLSHKFLGQTRISAPTYDFSEDGLFRIRLEIVCAPGQSESCVKIIHSILEEQYRVVLAKNSWVPHTKRVWRGENESGEEIVVSSDISSSNIFVAIQKIDLIERLRQKANPRRRSTAAPD